MTLLVPPIRPLTGREIEVAKLLAQGKGYGAIAAALVPKCSPRTVQSHVMRIAAKIPGTAAPYRRVLIWALKNLE